MGLCGFTPFLWCILAAAVNCAVVKIKPGLIEGTTGVSKGGRPFDVFYGIPYATPPVGKLRFKSPVEMTSWDGIRKATEKGIMCLQPTNFGVVDSPVRGQEDCLYLNVFTPNASKPSSKFPVIFFIHGGAYQSGDGSRYSGEKLLDKDIVYVAINYRLGSLGFLSLGNEVIPGNYGLKDQAFALKWVNQNIAAFGGDPNNVTIMGQSAGSSSVHFHLFSPLSKGLFHKAILMSGSAFAVPSYYPNEHSAALGNAFAVISGCYYTDQEAMLHCLQNLTGEEFIKKESHMFLLGSDPAALFKPAIEWNTKRAFLPQEPTKLSYVTKDIPVLTGITSAEGAFKIPPYFGGDGKASKEILNQIGLYLPILLQYKYTTNPKNINGITEKVKEFYFPNSNASDLDVKLGMVFSDIWFAFPLAETLLSMKGPRYAYLFNHRANYTVIGPYRYPKDLGVAHGDDLSLIVYNKVVESALTQADKEVSTRMVNYWTNFAIYGNPNGDAKEKPWEPVSSEANEYLHIKTDSDVMESNLWKDRVSFWRSLPLRRNTIVV